MKDHVLFNPKSYWANPQPNADFVPHEKIAEELSKVEKFEEQLEMLHELVRLTPEDLQVRERICQRILESIPTAKSFHLFGSSINGLGVKGCDIDVYLDMGMLHFFSV